MALSFFFSYYFFLGLRSGPKGPTSKGTRSTSEDAEISRAISGEQGVQQKIEQSPTSVEATIFYTPVEGLTVLGHDA